VLNTSGLKHEAGKDGGRGGEEPSSSQVRIGNYEFRVSNPYSFFMDPHPYLRSGSRCIFLTCWKFFFLTLFFYFIFNTIKP